MRSGEPSGESIPLHRQPVDVALLVELTTEVMQVQARTAGVTLTISVDDAVPDVVALDRDKIAWAIPASSEPRCGTCAAPGGVIVLHVGYDASRSTLRVSVRDDGPGIRLPN